ncbi:MAG: ABC transporter permease [Chloroflexi bacterium]|nr:ABC transporter permease [Chloroflexota bacterium]MBP8056279.1 ABC transporter permease [Chloroflexota bacterium]
MAVTLEAEANKAIKGRSPAADAFREFRRNKVAVIGAIFVVFEVLVALFAPILAPYGYQVQNVGANYQKPLTGYDIVTTRLDECHWADSPIEWGCTIYLAGSDALGRDLWSRVVYGSRVSLSVAIVASMVALVIGIFMGVLSGYAGGWVDNLIMRVVDFLYAVPLLPLIILVSVYFKALGRAGVEGGFTGFILGLDQASGGLFLVFVVIGILNWIGLARLARGQVLSYKRKEFIEAAYAMGAGHSRIMFRHLLPNILGTLLIAESLAIPGYIFLEAALSFIGLGVNPPTPSWGAMINEGYQGIQSNAYLVLVPGIALVLTTLAFNFMGDGLRDAFDPRQRGRH